jgi:serine/threonine protein phosphatase PrpC
MNNHEIYGNTISAKGKSRSGDFFHYESVNNFLVAVMADGVGSCDCDWLASELSINSFFTSFKAKIHDVSIEFVIKESIEEANKALLHHSDFSYLASTFIVLVLNLETNEFHCVSIGDSRIYLHKDNKTWQLTQDETEIEMTFDGKFYQPKSVLMNCLGNRFLKFTIKKKFLLANDGFILCTDGFHTIREHVNENEMEFVMNSDVLYLSFHKLFNWYAGYRKDDMSLLVCKINNNSEYLKFIK